MEIATRRIYEVLVVDMSGRLDSHSSGDAGDRFVDIVQGDDKRIVLNLSKLDYVSSAGLRVILRGAKLLQEKLGELKICNANQRVGKYPGYRRFRQSDQVVWHRTGGVRRVSRVGREPLKPGAHRNS
jgi:anti-anti-sigma factor